MMTFSEPSALLLLEAMDVPDYDDLPFGVVAMSRTGTVLAYNTYEAEAAGFDPERVIGKHFFREIAPCANNHLVGGLYDLEESVDRTIPYVFNLKGKATQVNLRILKGAASTQQFLLVERT